MRFGQEEIIRDVSIYVDQGELISLLGVSGSGKTTLFNCISGIYKPTEGHVFLDGEDISNSIRPVLIKPAPGVKPTFAYVPKEPFAMRKVHKAVVSIADIYGNATETPLYFFFDEPLDKGVFSLRKDGQMLLDGQPFFPIAAPYVIPLPVNDHNLDNAFTWLKNVGFNTVYSGRNAKYGEYMDKVAKYGMKMYVMPGNYVEQKAYELASKPGATKSAAEWLGDLFLIDQDA